MPGDVAAGEAPISSCPASISGTCVQLSAGFWACESVCVHAPGEPADDHAMWRRTDGQMLEEADLIGGETET